MRTSALCHAPRSRLAQPTNGWATQGAAPSRVYAARRGGRRGLVIAFLQAHPAASGAAAVVDGRDPRQLDDERRSAARTASMVSGSRSMQEVASQ